MCSRRNVTHCETSVHECVTIEMLPGAVFPIGSVRLSAPHRTAPHRRIFALLKTAPHRRIFALLKTAPHRTVGLTMSENRTEPHRRIEVCIITTI